MKLTAPVLPLLLTLLAACGAPATSSPAAAPHASPPMPASQAPAAAGTAPAPSPAPTGETAMPTPTGKPSDKIVRSDAEWKKLLTPEQYRVMRQKGTERAFTGKYEETTTPGVYKCAACGEPLFSSDEKFNAGCGWPAFSAPLDPSKVVETKDESYGMTRIEITCAKCGAHQGHVFDDGPGPTHLRYCINSVSIELEPKTGADAAKPAK